MQTRRRPRIPLELVLLCAITAVLVIAVVQSLSA